MASPTDLESGMQALAEHIESRQVSLPERPEKLLTTIKFALLEARDARILATSKDQIQKMLWISNSPVGGAESVGIYGGEKDFKRRGDKLRFIREDGAWFHFTITVGVRARQPLALVAYDFELCFSDRHVRENHFPSFVRFDLNEPGHKNTDRDLRAHMHPGHDDLITPALLMAPLEILRLFLYGGLVPPAKLRNPRGAADSLEPIL